MRGMLTTCGTSVKTIRARACKTLTPDCVLSLDVFGVHLLQGLGKAETQNWVNGKSTVNGKKENQGLI